MFLEGRANGLGFVKNENISKPLKTIYHSSGQLGIIF